MAGKLCGEWFWIDRWMGSAGYLLPMEPRGLLREMLSQAWLRGGRLPNNHREIRMATSCEKDEWERCWPLVSRFWREDGDSLVNDQQMEVLGQSERRADAQREYRARRSQRDNAPITRTKRKRQQIDNKAHSLELDPDQTCKSDASHPPVPAAAETGGPKLSTNPAVAAFQDAYAARYGSLPAINSFEAFGKGLAKAQAAKKDDVDGVRRAAGAFLACTEEFVAGKAHPWSEFVRQYDRWHEVARKEQLREQRRREIAEAAAVEQQTLKGVDFDPDRVKKMRQLVLAQSKEVGT